MDLRINSGSFPYRILSDGFYNRDGMCLLRSTNIIFMYCAGSFRLKRVKGLLWPPLD